MFVHSGVWAGAGMLRHCLHCTVMNGLKRPFCLLIAFVRTAMNYYNMCADTATRVDWGDYARLRMLTLIFTVRRHNMGKLKVVCLSAVYYYDEPVRLHSFAMASIV